MVLKYLMIIRELTLTLHRIDRYPLIIFNEFTSGCIPFFNHLKISSLQKQLRICHLLVLKEGKCAACLITV